MKLKSQYRWMHPKWDNDDNDDIQFIFESHYFYDYYSSFLLLSHQHSASRSRWYDEA